MLSPKQQADILAIIAKFCPIDEVKFDHYVTDWDFD
jgi:septum formation topological specificity factor MinE